MAAPADPQLLELLREHARYFEVLDSGRIKCLCNGHEFPPRTDVLAPFIRGQKFTTMRKRFDAEQSLAKYEPFITQSKNFPNMLYCTLTGQLMDKSMAAVKVHMKGKRFQHNKELFAADKKQLQPEPDIDTLMAEIMGRKAPNSLGEDDDKSHDDSTADEGESASGGSGQEDSSEADEALDEERAPEPRGRARSTGMDVDVTTTLPPAQQAVTGAKRGRRAEDVPADGASQQQRAKRGAGRAGKREKPHSRPGISRAADDAPAFWVPDEFAELEQAPEADPEGHGKGGMLPKHMGKRALARGKGKPAPPADSDFEFSDAEDGAATGNGAAAGNGAVTAQGSGRMVTTTSIKPKKRNVTRPSKAKKARSEA